MDITKISIFQCELKKFWQLNEILKVFEIFHFILRPILECGPFTMYITD